MILAVICYVVIRRRRRQNTDENVTKEKSLEMKTDTAKQVDEEEYGEEEEGTYDDNYYDSIKPL